MVLKRGDDAEGKGYAWVAGELRRGIVAGNIPAGQPLPSTKQLGSEYGVSSETARRAAKQLEAEGLLESHPRHGFRVLARANDPDRGLPIAFIVSAVDQSGLWGEFHRMLFAGLQQAAQERGWALLAIGAGRRTPHDVMAQLRDCRACGIVLDSMNKPLLDAVAKMGLPAVMMDSWESDMRLDAVVQDSFQGALLAVRHLVERGHKRIGWLGRTTDSAVAQERFGGTVAGIAAAGLPILTEFLQDTPAGSEQQVAHKMLSRRDRPTGLLGLWQDPAVQLVSTADDLGLKLGRDVDVVGWTSEESYPQYTAQFKTGLVPPIMVWSIADLARMAIERLAARRLNPALTPVLVKLPARLKIPEPK
jgi:GntR family transcriptional regulator, arabinose operon transcriptional repressor